MQATAGDVIRLRGNARGQRDRVGCVIDARGAGGGPPYLVRFTDGRVSLVYEAPGGLAERPAQTLAMLWLGSVYDDHQRCIDAQTMTVIPSAAC
jgi:hypothetical protein